MIYRRYPGVEGSAYLVGGVGVNYLQADGIVLAPIRTGVGLRLGANVGTTITALLASLATNRPEALTIALVHTLFNAAGIMLFYPVPTMRRIPLWLAQRGADVAATHRPLVAVYVLGVFIVVPLVGVLALR